MGLGRYVARRGIYIVVLLLLVVTFSFFLFQVLPFEVSCPGMTSLKCAYQLYLPPPPSNCGNSVACYKMVMCARAASVNNTFGFAEPLPVRFVLYLKAMFTFNFGCNVGIAPFPGATVLSTIVATAPYTLILVGLASIASFLVGTGIGAVTAAMRGKALDVSSCAILLFLNSLPVFFLGALLMLAQLGLTSHHYIALGWLEIGMSGWAFDVALLRAFFLPFVTLTLAGTAGVFLAQRGVMADTMKEDYVLMARAKGLPETTVVRKHALRNVVLPVASAFSIFVGITLSGAVVTEVVFSWPGLGEDMYSGMLATDYPLVQAAFFIFAIMMLAALFVGGVTYGFLDPRVRGSAMT